MFGRGPVGDGWCRISVQFLNSGSMRKRFSHISLLVEFAAMFAFATHRPNSLLQLAEFGLEVNEKSRNNLCARWIDWFSLSIVQTRIKKVAKYKLWVVSM